MPLLLGITLYALYVEYKPIQQCHVPHWEEKPPSNPTFDNKKLEKVIASYLEREDVREILADVFQNEFTVKERRFITSNRVKGILLDESRQNEMHRRLDTKIRAAIGFQLMDHFFHSYMICRPGK